ncbi:fam-c protein [Plasmodium chabaudi adami]|uniref:Fam-c protein n=1 Tax=Plasmodium chabaudi adami TaxID=5826 RepID=A0A1C6WMR0_PLACE|nr:fam-c protein [Plasmodium chabaudi adami]SCL97297.1 fam-c protein [Plasmodium chabaudi adami]
MNKRILSLVCIALYALLDVSVHCAQHKEYDVGNESARDTEEINRSNEKNGIKFNHRNPLKNKYPKDVDADDDPDKYYEEEEEEEDEHCEEDKHYEEDDDEENNRKKRRYLLV